MGVSGSGKTTLGKKLAAFLDLPFIEGDQFHATENIEKMKSGIPLNDQDRVPWLADLNEALIREKNTGVVLACSALKQKYRDLLSQNIPSNQLLWVYLACDTQTLQERMQNRNHFMPTSLLKSQLETLEVPKDALHLDAKDELKILINQIKTCLHEQ
jgi:carbohydrate kinase (thermoresistant glucokinase family)